MSCGTAPATAGSAYHYTALHACRGMDCCAPVHLAAPVGSTTPVQTAVLRALHGIGSPPTGAPGGHQIPFGSWLLPHYGPALFIPSWTLRFAGRVRLRIPVPCHGRLMLVAHRLSVGAGTPHHTGPVLLHERAAIGMALRGSHLLPRPLPHGRAVPGRRMPLPALPFHFMLPDCAYSALFYLSGLPRHFPPAGAKRSTRTLSSWAAHTYARYCLHGTHGLH